jgi:TRAP-type C4-dicarboxylate transport system substrate-binding protein
VFRATCAIVVVKTGKAMFKVLVRCALFSFALVPGASVAEPIKLKLAYFSSDREPPYLAVLKPFADAVNNDAKGILEIQVYPGGVLGRGYGGQPQLVLDGTADMAWINPSLTPQLFTDAAIMQLPGLFRDLKEATMAHTSIVGAEALGGYEKFFAIGSFANYPLMIHTRSPIASLADLRGRKIRANSLTEVMTLKALGIESVVLPVNEIALAIGRGAIDGTTMPPGSLFDYGISRITKYHYVGHFGAAPLNFLMNREKFDSLPTAGRDAIRRYSGGWAAARFVEAYDARNDSAMAQLRSDPMRKVIFPSQADLESSGIAFRTVIEAWVAKSPRNSELLKLAEREIAKLRATR